MFRYSLSWYIFACTLLESIIKTHLTAHDSSHGFIANNHKYFDEEMSAIHVVSLSADRNTERQILNNTYFLQISGLGVSSSGEDGASPLTFQLRFEPSYLDFKKRPLGVPHLEKVTLFNGDSNRSIDMTSISGSTVHFHSSFFEDKKIPPLGNTSFNVVFLGREEGFVESSLFIHTNEGHFKYDVKGSSVYSPYRLRPIVGVKLPVNTSFSPLIYMHNPHSEAIQIVEVYSSGGEFHLELPSGELEGPKDMWEIPPLQTKAIIRVRFQGKTEQNHTAYVRIKLNNTEEVLVVPLEVEVTSTGSIYHPVGFLDFGVGGSLDPPKELDICVHNPLKKSMRIHSVFTSSKSMKVQYDNVKLQPETKTDSGCVSVGKLILDWKAAFQNKDYSGKVTIKYKNGRGQTEIPYYLSVLDGGLTYDKLLTRYFVNDKSDGLPARKFKVKNDFKTSVRLLSVSLVDNTQKYFTISGFKPLILKPGSEVDIFTINMKPGVKLAELKLNSHIFLKTNISELTIPLLSYNGKLDLHLPFKAEEYQWDLGLFSLNTKKEIRFLLCNRNPVDVELKSLKIAVPMTNIEILGCGKGNHTLALLQDAFKNLTLCEVIRPNEYAVAKLTVRTAATEGQVWGDLQVATQYENRSVPVIFKVAPGKLEIGSDHLLFDHCFPGKICSHPLQIHSTFSEPMVIEDITSLPPDPRISSKHSNHILAREAKFMGHLYLDPSIGCINKCYAGLQHDTTAQWLRTLNLWKSVPEFDLNLVNTFYNRYLNVTQNGYGAWHNLTLRLDTTEVKGEIFRSRVKMVWPRLLTDNTNQSVFGFPLTQIGNTTYRNITLRNPSSYSLIVQIVMDKHYPGVQALFEGMPPRLLPENTDVPRSVRHNFFFHPSHKDKLQSLKRSLDLGVHEETIPVLLAPGEKFTFTVGFKGEDTNLHTALIFLRNNLTMIETLKLTGRGSYPMFKFGNRKPGSPQPLVFELTDKHLKDCERDKPYRSPTPNLTVKRSFTARNIGDVTIYVNNFYINGYPCEGYGFKVLNCGPFILHPNSTKKIDIAFTPDLTLTKVVRTLILDTSLGFQVNYTLHTTIPYQYLSICSNVIMRPEWEIYLSYVCVGLMAFFLVGLLIVAFVNSSRIRNQAFGAYNSPPNATTHPILDLRLVGQQIRAEMRSSKQDAKADPSVGKHLAKVDNAGSDGEVADEPVKVKPSGEKAAVVPATGKSKKKLAKKNSNEVNVHETPEQKKSCEQKSSSSKPKVEEKIEEKKTVASAKKSQPNKKNVKSPVNVVNTVAYEEETSSTTTEGSSNNEDGEKENEQRNQKICPKKVISKIACTHEEIAPKDLSQSPSVPAKPERRRLGQKNLQKNNRVDTHDKNDQHHKQNPENRKGHKNNRERRDKQTLNRKMSADKARSCESKNCDSRLSATARVSPTISSNIWTENKASFSDVVARNDSSATRPLGHTQTSKPTMYVEPYKQTSPHLGPIGSRRDLWQEGDGLGLASSGAEEPPSRISNSYFSNAQDLPVDSGQPFMDDIIGGEAWSTQQQPALMNLFEPNMCTSRPDTWNHCNSGITVNSYWNNFNILGNNIPVQQPPPQPPQPMNDQTGYLWGSSPVWAWAPPEVPRTPTRTPPGFDAVLQRSREEQMQQAQQQQQPQQPQPQPQPQAQPPQHQQRDSYNPFTTSNIWTQPETYPWDYPHH